MTSDATPRHLLLATDLSARCDRAGDRALSLARTWGAKLTVVHAQDSVEVPTDEPPSRPEIEPALRVARQLRADFSDVTDVEVGFQIRKGRPEDVVPQVASELRCDLIVTGIAGNDAAGQVILGSLVRHLRGHTTVPVLVVKKRPRRPYRGVIVATDMSEASAVALKMALALFPADELTLFHAFDPPLRSWTDDKAQYDRAHRDGAVAEARAFVEKVGGADAAGAIRIAAERGNAAELLASRGVEQADLVIAGTHGRTALMTALIGSVATAILDEVPCDVMLVPLKGARTSS